MIQLLRITRSKDLESGKSNFKIVESNDDEIVYPVISGSDAVKFFIKRIIYLIIFVYATLFLAVAVPFVKTPFIPIYYIGSFATLMYIARLVNHIVKYIKFRNGSVSITGKRIEAVNKKNEGEEKHFFDISSVRLKDSANTTVINAGNIGFLELNLLGNLVILDKDKKIPFPAMLLSEENRDSLLSLFPDMTPMRTVYTRKVWEILDAVVVALILAVHIIQYIVQAYYIPTGSMQDTLLVGDHLFVEKITYGPIIPKMPGMDNPFHLSFLGIRSLERGDIVIFKPPNEEDKDYIKRCIALPGDKLEIKDGYVYLNGKKQVEPYVRGTTVDDARSSRVQGIVPEGKAVVLGDNRENSQDGRYFGYLDIKEIKGRAFILYWNTEQILNLDFSRVGLIR
ncbi:MAG: signal peptidase I [bacterium]|nr:signal peptidase I [bacterium]